MLGTHAVESQTGKLSRQVLEKQNLSGTDASQSWRNSPNRPMTCPLCGKATSCVHTRRNTSALVDHSVDSDIFASDEQVLAPPVAALRAVAGEQRSAADPAWRREIVSRVQQHRARRRR